MENLPGWTLEDPIKPEVVLTYSGLSFHNEHIKNRKRYSELVDVYNYYRLKSCRLWWGRNHDWTGPFSSSIDTETAIRLAIKTSEAYSDAMFYKLGEKAKFYVMCSASNELLSYFMTDDDKNLDKYLNSVVFKHIKKDCISESKPNLSNRLKFIYDIRHFRSGASDKTTTSNDEFHLIWRSITGDYKRVN